MIQIKSSFIKPIFLAFKENAFGLSTSPESIVIECFIKLA